MERLVEDYNTWVNSESDPRVHGWFLMSSPLPTIAICVAFLVFAIFLRICMKQREAMNIRWMIWGFDFFHLAASSILMFIIIKLRLLNDFNFR